MSFPYLPRVLGRARTLSAVSPLLEQLLQVRAIIDASIIQTELRWRLVKRFKSHARSDLTEAMAAGVVVASGGTTFREEAFAACTDVLGATALGLAMVICQGTLDSVVPLEPASMQNRR
jgi:hypothetical protein